MELKNKILLISIFVLIGYGLYRFVKFGFDNTREKSYCGKVIKCYITPAGYKVSPSRHVVFYNDSLKRNIDVRVTNQQFVNTKEGEYICFDLNRMQLEE